ncbi:PAS domain-containing hybrid sensor histidine kinase/response regulator [Aureimonas ureilytica]|uniref:PAS domain-containing hybrid sensor histidine kinase/response regulator n=1 Tax=Aureimonas ureilytica TaxID=401562 RepID=UPI0003652D77|nr:PAS domain-containing protein [Aureimonas ureilytica]
MFDTQSQLFRQALADGGACGALIASENWEDTPLGALATWPVSLRMAVSLMLRSPVPMVILWGEDGIMLYNDAYSRFAGKRHPDLLGAKVHDGWPEVAAFNRNVLQVVLAGGTLQYRDQEFTLDRTGRLEPVWLNLDFSPIPDEAGRPGGVLCVLGETTDRIRAERQRDAARVALRETDAQFQLMVNSVPQIIWIADGDGRMEYLNRQFTEYTGAGFSSMSPSEIAGAFIHPADAPKVVAAFQSARDEGKPHSCEHRIRSASGEYRWFLDRAEPYRDQRTGRITRWFGSSVDIHDRKIAEDRLRAANDGLTERVAERTAERDILATLVEHTDILVMAVDLDFNILALNAANADEFERIFGIRPKAGDNMLALLADQPQHQEEVRAGWARGLSGEHVDFVETFGDPNRARPYYEIKFRPLFDEGGRLIGAYQFVIDVSDRLRREAQLAEAQLALRQSQKMEAIGQLTGGVAHDFNNLLMAVLGNLELLRKHADPDPRTRRLIDGAMSGAQRGAALTQRLLAFARRQDLQLEPRNLADLVKGMVELLEQSIGAAVELRLLPPDVAAVALVDANQLELAILNLAVNARDAMPNGGELTIAIERRAGDGELAPGDYVCLTVSDTGSGMDADTLKRSTEPFFSTKGVGKGTGLGLSMIHGLAVQLNGALRLSSVPGQGTRAELWLPAAESKTDIEVPIPTAPASTRDHKPTRARILVVDDDMLIAMSTLDMLQDLGHETVEANSGQEALDILRSGAVFDLMITDFAMPRMNGGELAEAALALRPDLPILLATGYAELPPGMRLDLPRLGKPYSQSQLANEINRLLAS